MGEFLTVEKQRDYLAEIPENMKDAALQDLINRGHELEGVNQDFSFLDTALNVPGSLLEFGKNVVSAIANPRQTLKAVSSVADGAVRSGVRNILGIELSEGELGSEEDEKAFNAMIDFFSERYGGGEKILETIERDPVGFLSDAATFLTGGGAVLSVAGKASKIARLADAGKTASKIGSLLEPTRNIGAGVKVAGKATRAAARQGLKATGIDKLVNKTSDRFMMDVLDVDATQLKNLRDSARLSENPVTFMTKHGISGSLEKMKMQLQHIKEQTMLKVDSELSKVQGQFKRRDTGAMLNELRNQITKEFTDTGSQSGAAVRFARENLSDEMLNSLDEINSLIAKNTNEGLSLVEIQRAKRLSDDFLDIFKVGGEAKSGVKFKNLESLRRSTRRFIENQAPGRDIGKLNQQTQLAKGLEKVMQNRIDFGKTRTPFLNRIQGIIVGGGIAGSFFSGGIAPLVKSVGLLGATELMKIPAVKAYWSTRLRLLTQPDFDALVGAIDTGKLTPKAVKIIQRERDRFRRAMPTLRIGDITREQQEATQ